MIIENPLICVATPKNDKVDTTTFKSTEAFNLNSLFMLQNSVALSTVYNHVIYEALESNVDCLIFVHDDVILEENPIPKLEKLFDSYDLVGVAGTSKIAIQSPALWHLMGGGFGSGNLHGKVNHINPSLKKEPTVFGPYPHRVVMIDGVFMALNRKAMENICFDEKCPSKWHMYDILLSLDAFFKKIKIGVGDISITHESPGLREFTEDWKTGESYFLNKYAN